MKLRQLLPLAWKESRFARRRLFLFLSAISLGVAALVAVQGFAANMRAEVRNQARTMLGADVMLASREPFRPTTVALLDSIAGTGTEIVRVTSFASMALHPVSGDTRLVQVRAPEPGFPFYGTIETSPAGEWASLHEGRNVIVDPALLIALDAQVGDSLAIGATRFRITAALERVPGDVEIASSFAPRVFLPASTLPETELLGYGARVDYEVFLRIPDAAAAEAFVDAHRETLRTDRVRARTSEDQQESIAEALDRLSDFLGLTGVFALLLGGIGVASAMGAYMARKAESVAILRCLGATSGQVFAVYLIQAGMMGLAGAVVGVVMGGGVQWLLPRLLEGLLPVDVPIRLSGMAVVTGIAVGVWTAVAFAVLPLLQVRAVSPLSALRRRVEPVPAAPADPLRIGAWALLIASVFGLVIQQAGDLRVGVAVTGAIAVTFGVLRGVARVATTVLRRTPRAGLAYTIRQGIANLYRPGNQTVTVVLALGFGVFLLATLLLTQANLLRPLAIDAESRGNLLLFDVQDDQVAGIEEVLARENAEVLHSAAIVPMQIAAINGVEVWPAGMSADRPDPDEFEPAGPDGERPSGWAARREYRSTFRDTMQASETLVAGQWWRSGAGAGPGGSVSPGGLRDSGRTGNTASAAAGPAPEGTFEVSLDRDVATELDVGIGDRIDWDVQGIRIPTIITSLRQVDWARFEPNFYAVFEPAALDGAPRMWIFLARSDDPAVRAIVQRDIVTRFPNVASIDLTLVQRAFDDVVGRISLVIRFLAGFSVATGFIVLLGAVATGRLQRIRESVLLKTLGATRRQIAVILLTEYALLGLLAAAVGIGLSLAAGWALAHFLFEISFAIEPLPILSLAVTIASLSAAVGLSASREVFRSTPMEAIREE